MKYRPWSSLHYSVMEIKDLLQSCSCFVGLVGLILGIDKKWPKAGNYWVVDMDSVGGIPCFECNIDACVSCCYIMLLLLTLTIDEITIDVNVLSFSSQTIWNMEALSQSFNDSRPCRFEHNQKLKMSTTHSLACKASSYSLAVPGTSPGTLGHIKKVCGWMTVLLIRAQELGLFSPAVSVHCSRWCD